MEFQLNNMQKMIADSAREIGKRFGPDYWLEKEENHELPVEFIKETGKAGIIGCNIPEQYGGESLGLTEVVIAFKEMCVACGGAGPILLGMLGSIFGGMSILKHGSEEQKRKYLPKICTGEMLVCLGVTEPDAGTNTLNIKTFARKDGDDYVITGNKIFISGFEQSGAIVLITRTTKIADSPKNTMGMSVFLIDLPNDAIQSTEIPKHGVNYIPTYELGIDELRVPGSCLLGEEGAGWYHILDTLNPERIMTAVGGIGVGKAAISKAVKYANERKVFQTVIGAHQGIQFPLASAYAKLECAWLATQKAAVLYDQEAPQKQVGDISNIAKYSATEAGIEAVYHSMQTLGGYGYAKEYHIERWWREAQLLRLAPITQQMTLNYTAEHILGLPRSY